MKRTAGFATSLALALTIGAALAGDFEDVTPKNTDWRPNGAHLSVAQAVHIAEAVARERNLPLSEYLGPKFLYSRDHHWVITYMGKAPMPGNFFSVDIDDRTQHATLMPGF